MRTIAILGATGQIARGLAAELAGAHRLMLFARRPEAVVPPPGAEVHGLDTPFAPETDAIVNAIGAGDPRAIRVAGAAIETVTETFDARVLAHLERHPRTRYVFLSTGAVYGPDYDDFELPERLLAAATRDPGEHYAFAKLAAEARHRARSELTIADVRLFGYFSRHIDLDGGFLMSEIARAVARGAPFHTDSTDFSRDYVGPRDLARLVRCLLVAAPGYRLVEAYSAGATTKSALLARLAREFALRWRISDGATTFSPPKPFKGLPLVHSAVGVGYVPSEASEETIVRELRAMWASPAGRTAREVMS